MDAPFEATYPVETDSATEVGPHRASGGTFEDQSQGSITVRCQHPNEKDMSCADSSHASHASEVCTTYVGLHVQRPDLEPRVHRRVGDLAVILRRRTDHSIQIRRLLD